MAKRIKVGVDESIPIEITSDQRDLILNHTFAGPDLTERLEVAPLSDTKIVAGYTLSDIDELMGYIAAEANHSKDRKLRRKLDRLYDYLQTFEERYEDELSAPRS